jgi:hypothetical protein
VVKVVRWRTAPELLAKSWRTWLPRQIPDRLVIAEELEGKVIELEGRDLIVVELGHTDTDDTTCLHVPSIGLVETRQYIRDFDRIAGATATARELYDGMLELYPHRVNPGRLWASARAVKP